MIKRTSHGYTVFGKYGKKKLSKEYKTLKEALKRLKQIEYFKHKK